MWVFDGLVGIGWGWLSERRRQGDGVEMRWRGDGAALGGCF